MKKLFLLFLSLFIGIQAKYLEYEDTYLIPASEHYVQTSEEAANLINFTKSYELTNPKKAAITINPFNKFIAGAINPITKNPLIIVNPEWFDQLSTPEQQFLLAKTLIALDNLPQWSTWFPFISVPLMFILYFIIYLLLNKTPLNRHSKWLKIIATIACGMAINWFIIQPSMLKLQNYLLAQHDIKIIKKTIDKTEDSSSAYNALMKLFLAFKNETDPQIHELFKPQAERFEYLASQFKK